MPHDITDVLKNQFDSGFLMLEKCVDVIPDTYWTQEFNGVKLWKRVFHIAYFIDYWLRTDYMSLDFLSMTFSVKISPEINKPCADFLTISRAAMKEYLYKIKQKLSMFFAELDDFKITQLIAPTAKNHTYADVIIGQIRHIMYNLGYINNVLRSNSLPESDWYSYNEVEEAE